MDLTKWKNKVIMELSMRATKPWTIYTMKNKKDANLIFTIGIAFFVILVSALTLRIVYTKTAQAQELAIIEDISSSSAPVLSEGEKIMQMDLSSAVDILKTDLLAPVDDKFKQDVIIEMDKQKMAVDNLASKYAQLYDGCKNK